MANSAKKNAEGLNQQALINVLQRIANMSFYNPVLAIGSGSKKKVLITTGATGLFMIDGVLYVTPASQEVAFTATTHDIAPSATKAQERLFLVCLDSAGTGSLISGEVADAGKAVAPEVPATKCVIGKVLISIAAGATKFDASSDDLDAGHITDTYTNLGMLVY